MVASFQGPRLALLSKATNLIVIHCDAADILLKYRTLQSRAD